MNVGPTSRGYIDQRAEESLAVYAKWMKYNSRSIYGCTMAESEFIPPVGTRLTQSEDGSRLYIHLIEYPATWSLTMRGLAGKIDYAQFLHDGSEILYREGSDGFAKVGMEDTDDMVVFSMPVLAGDVIDPVIEVFLKK
jgi:alpha-L-fucosidase